ncbi:MAG: TfoX/Sxy family protein [bacterium]|nr:TfoX/Sxy family protein [bacterium]
MRNFLKKNGRAGGVKQKQGRDEDTDYLQDILQPLGRIRLRRMFGGYGIYADELFFALVIGGQLYFKTDALTRPQFEAAGLEEWVYEKEGKPVHMNYFRPPEAIFDEEDELLLWGRLALAAALRTRRPVKKATGEKPPARQSAAGKSAPGKSSAEKSAVEKVAGKSVVNKVRAAGKSGGKTGSGTPHE